MRLLLAGKIWALRSFLPQKSHYAMRKQGIDGIIRYVQRECASGLCIDELGREPSDAKHFGTGLNVIQTVLQLRYEFRYEYCTHATTNLELNDIPARYGIYIADRCKEMFNIIHVDGDTRRK